MMQPDVELDLSAQDEPPKPILVQQELAMSIPDLYEKLRKHLDVMSVPFPKTDSRIELRLLEYLFDPPEAEVALCISALAEPARRIHRRYGSTRMSIAEMETLLETMVQKGSIRAGTRVRRGTETRVYGKLPFAVGMYETQLNKLTKSFENDARDYFHGRFLKDFYDTKPVQLRTIPINERVTVDKTVGSYDDIRRLVKDLPGPFAVHRCICSEGMELNGHTCQITEVTDRCISLGNAATNVIHDGLGREISKEDLVAFFDKAEAEGLVIQANNVLDPLYICCCCSDCCGLLTSIAKLPNPGELVSANYSVAIQHDGCIGCKACLERCPMGALHMQDDTIAVKAERCIGCGLCVPVCPKEVLALKRKTRVDEPLADNARMHRKIFLNRYGPVKAAMLFLKGLLGFCV
jgi:ferredoxin